MTEALKLDPSNKDVRRELNFLREKEREATEKQKKIWSNTLARGLDDGEDEGQGGLSSEGGAAAERSNASSASRGSGAAAAASERESKAREAKAEIQRYLDELEQQPERPAAAGGWGLGWIKNTTDEEDQSLRNQNFPCQSWSWPGDGPGRAPGSEYLVRSGSPSLGGGRADGPALVQ
eukprot:760789-Hanusia_phi.AAC.10